MGTAGDDIICGLGGDDVICGLGGDDVIYGLGGDDIIVGGAGDDTLYGGDATLNWRNQDLVDHGLRPGVSTAESAELADFRVPALGGLVLWLVVYASAMWGRNGRGWHDLAAGTVVISDPAPQQSQFKG